MAKNCVERTGPSLAVDSEKKKEKEASGETKCPKHNDLHKSKILTQIAYRLDASADLYHACVSVYLCLHPFKKGKASTKSHHAGGGGEALGTDLPIYSPDEIYRMSARKPNLVFRTGKINCTLRIAQTPSKQSPSRSSKMRFITYQYRNKKLQVKNCFRL